ncbi:MAG: hypothetical protein OEY33_08750 [Bdellovibrionales bacterium]|nr:hypothetical protein [Bdellovibrionales bacterium]
MNRPQILCESLEITELLEKFIEFQTVLTLNNNIKAVAIFYNYYSHEVVLRPLEGYKFDPINEWSISNDAGNINFKAQSLGRVRAHFLKIRLPLKVTIHERRRSYREEFREYPFAVIFNNVQTLTHSLDSILDKALLVNISEYGVFLKSKGRQFQNYNLNDRIIFTSIHDYPIKKKISGQIKYIHRNPKDMIFFIGIEFDHPLEITGLIEYLEEKSGKAKPNLRQEILEELRKSHGKFRSSTPPY